MPTWLIITIGLYVACFLLVVLVFWLERRRVGGEVLENSAEDRAQALGPAGGSGHRE